jgi:hypothetical protein
MNSQWDHFNYWTKYGATPLARHFAVEFKNLSDAEAAMSQYLASVKRFNLLDWIGDVWDDVVHFITKDRDKERMEAYLSQATDHADLEKRLKDWDNRNVKKPGFYI